MRDDLLLISEGYVSDFHACVAGCWVGTGVHPWIHVSYNFEFY